MIISSVSVKQILFALAATLSLHLIFWKVISPRIPYSRFFKIDTQKLQRQIKMQKETSLKALSDYREYNKGKGTVFNRPDSKKKLCVSFPTVSRQDSVYLEQTVASLLTRTQLVYQDEIQITAYNVDYPPSKHTQAKNLSDLIQVDDLSYLDVDPDAGDIPRSKIKNKEILDYISVLEAEDKRDCQFYLVLEDDVLASQNWLKKVYEVMEMMEDKPIAMVKLFSVHRRASSRWRHESPADILFISLITIGITSLLYLSMVFVAIAVKKIKERRSDNAPELVKNPKKTSHWGRFSSFDPVGFAVLLLGVLSFVIVANRCTFFPEKKGFHETDTPLFYQANLYSKHMIKNWAQFYRNIYFTAKKTKKPTHPKDCYLDIFIEEQKKITGIDLKGMAFTPSIFQHTGVKSSIDNYRTLEIADISYSFPDDDVPIVFNREFIESSP